MAEELFSRKSNADNRLSKRSSLFGLLVELGLLDSVSVAVLRTLSVVGKGNNPGDIKDIVGRRAPISESNPSMRFTVVADGATNPDFVVVAPPVMAAPISDTKPPKISTGVLKDNG